MKCFVCGRRITEGGAAGYNWFIDGRQVHKACQVRWKREKLTREPA